jgi:glyoxylase-like metal-dependent hydrolase (beta-lactamase superfamily II)
MDAPGHTFDSLIFYEPSERALFTGDVILGEGYVVVAPPGGAMRPYQATLRRLRAEFADAATIYGGHGPPVLDPRSKIDDYIEHRREREAQVLAELERSPQTIPELVRAIYAGTPEQLWPAAARQLLAHLNALEDEGRVRSLPAERAPNAWESAILNPSWRALAGDANVDVAEAEFGAQLHIDALRRYDLAP